MLDFERCNNTVKKFVSCMDNPVYQKGSKLYTGVDLGTAIVVVSVLDENFNPVCGAYRNASVVKDGMVVDYIGAVGIVRELKQEIEEKIGTELQYAAAAIPPGTSSNDNGAVRYVCEGAGFEVTNMLDEPSAANSLLGIQDGAVVDIGGGTTGIAVFKDGRTVYTADEATGGTHFTLVLAGGYGIPYEEAEMIKRDFNRHREIFPVLKPVVQKVSSIIREHIKGFDVNDIYLVGGTSCLSGIETVIEQELKIPVHKPANPLYVTPLGIAMNCLLPE